MCAYHIAVNLPQTFKGTLTIPLVSVSFLSVGGTKFKIMTQELLDKIYNETLNKPSSFHFLCYGGGTVKMVDKHINEKTFTCKYQGDKNWLTPSCEKCTGLTAESESLTDYAQTLNYGMRSLYDALSRALANER